MGELQCGRIAVRGNWDVGKIGLREFPCRRVAVCGTFVWEVAVWGVALWGGHTVR